MDPIGPLDTQLVRHENENSNVLYLSSSGEQAETVKCIKGSETCYLDQLHDHYYLFDL